ncbi:YihY/virulence factor BrkB family protein [Mycoplasma sp. Ms02]|uniref:YihY/virulence factor BrkB family protein n=1 Tax=Mycoplasma sp. Ms02 TaxID=353851 RepID=UPI001C8A8259|nr:YhjD/YihY/BrkB family envelope integrity protein [Mycoplasma sp. Ms02]QZE12549.1 YihY/virulence factor BrkB family protein [Mycoplasma sp. Ms02]
MFYQKNNSYKKYFRKHKRVSLTLKRDIKKDKFYHNIIWKPLLNFNPIEVLLKTFIKFLIITTIFNKYRKQKTKSNEMIDRAYERFASREFAFMPSSNTMYFILSFVPIVMISYLFLNVFSFIGPIHKFLLDIILPTIIPGIQAITQQIEDTQKSSALGGSSLFFLCLSAIWFSSNGYGKLISSQNIIYKHKYTGTSIGNRLKGFFVVCAISVYLSFWTVFAFLISKSTHSISLVNEGVSLVIEDSTKQFAIIAVLSIPFVTLGMFLMYKFTPSFKLRIQDVKIGVIIASVPCWSLLLLLGVIARFASFGQYGPIGIFMFLSLFIGFYTYFLYLGIIMNEAYYKSFISEDTLQKRSLFKI